MHNMFNFTREPSKESRPHLETWTWHLSWVLKIVCHCGGKREFVAVPCSVTWAKQGLTKTAGAAGHRKKVHNRKAHCFALPIRIPILKLDIHCSGHPLLLWHPMLLWHPFLLGHPLPLWHPLPWTSIAFVTSIAHPLPSVTRKLDFQTSFDKKISIYIYIYLCIFIFMCVHICLNQWIHVPYSVTAACA